MIRFIPTLLLIPIYSLAADVACAADAPDSRVRIAAISAPVHTTPPKTPIRVEIPDAESHQENSAATVPREATAPRRHNAPAFDLLSSDLRSIEEQEPQQVIALSDSDETQAVAIVAASLPPQMSSGTDVSHAGLGALYWMVRNPAQAWRVLLPIQPRDGSGASEDLREKCAIFARAPGSRVACP